MNFVSHVGGEIRRYRKTAGLTQEQLAKESGFSVTTVKRYENGVRAPRIDHLSRLANALHVPISAFVRLEGDKTMLYGRPDPQDEAPRAYCIHCGGEIYAGDEAVIPVEHAGMVHADCYRDWLFETYADQLGVKCEVGA
ncbi:MAG TPA: hypothetical protein DDX59_06615 [Lachnospiraceae bacterium]|nr:hypothetical protein [Lachnospiraceae bacterium]